MCSQSAQTSFVVVLATTVGVSRSTFTLDRENNTRIPTGNQKLYSRQQTAQWVWGSSLGRVLTMTVGLRGNVSSPEGGTEHHLLWVSQGQFIYLGSNLNEKGLSTWPLNPKDIIKTVAVSYTITRSITKVIFQDSIYAVADTSLSLALHYINVIKSNTKPKLFSTSRAITFYLDC